jgi:transcriptional regulator
VGEFVATYEQGMPSPWQLETGTPFFDKLLKAIVGFEIDITRIEGKWKLGQNQPAENREKAAMHLSQRSDPLAGEIARLMRETLD